MTTREIQHHLQELYGVEVSPALISKVTDAVLDEVQAWQARPLDAVYPIVYLDAIHLKMRTQRPGPEPARCTWRWGSTGRGTRSCWGFGSARTEGAKFWLNVLTELRNRGVKDILIACVDGLTGFPDAIGHVFPQTQVQLCIVHMVRNSLRYVSWKERRLVAQDLRSIYTAATAEAGLAGAGRVRVEVGRHDSPRSARRWRAEVGEPVAGFFGYPPEIRKVIYTTNAIESINSRCGR